MVPDRDIERALGSGGAPRRHRLLGRRNDRLLNGCGHRRRVLRDHRWGLGGFDPGFLLAIPGIRRAEQEAAGAVLGVADVRFLAIPTGAWSRATRYAGTSPG